MILEGWGFLAWVEKGFVLELYNVGMTEGLKVSAHLHTQEAVSPVGTEVFLLPPARLTAKMANSAGEALALLTQWMTKDRRLGLLAENFGGQVVMTKGDSINQPHMYGYFFDHEGRLMHRVDDEGGLVEVLAELPIDRIRVLGGGTVSLEKVALYAEQFDESPFPPLCGSLVSTVTDEPYAYLVNGRHRLAAAKRTGEKSVRMWLSLGDYTDQSSLRVPKFLGEVLFEGGSVQRFKDALELMAR